MEYVTHIDSRDRFESPKRLGDQLNRLVQCSRNVNRWHLIAMLYQFTQFTVSRFKDSLRPVIIQELLLIDVKLQTYQQPSSSIQITCAQNLITVRDGRRTNAPCIQNDSSFLFTSKSIEREKKILIAWWVVRACNKWSFDWTKSNFMLLFHLKELWIITASCAVHYKHTCKLPTPTPVSMSRLDEIFIAERFWVSKIKLKCI